MSFRQSGAASALGPVWVQSLIKKPSTFTQRHKTAGRDEREGPSTRCTVTSTQQLSERGMGRDGKREEKGGVDNRQRGRGSGSGLCGFCVYFEGNIDFDI